MYKFCRQIYAIHHIYNMKQKLLSLSSCHCPTYITLANCHSNNSIGPEMTPTAGIFT
jgi:hypothetical protein